MQSLRPMREGDIDAVLEIQQHCYPQALLETEAVIRARLAAHPEFAWVAEDAEGVCAYLFAYPSQLGKVTPLDAEFPAVEAADCLYLHDLAVHPRAAGRGLGPALVRHKLALGKARQLRHSALVSVQASEAFWARQGFTPREALTDEQREHLASYRVAATYMTRPLH